MRFEMQRIREKFPAYVIGADALLGDWDNSCGWASWKLEKHFFCSSTSCPTLDLVSGSSGKILLELFVKTTRCLAIYDCLFTHFLFHRVTSSIFGLLNPLSILSASTLLWTALVFSKNPLHTKKYQCDSWCQLLVIMRCMVGEVVLNCILKIGLFSVIEIWWSKQGYYCPYIASF